MRTSTDEAMAPSREPTDMSAEGPSNPIGDRPRMAEALASLKEGLRDTADPLYDGWKRRPRAPAQPPRPSTDREKANEGDVAGAPAARGAGASPWSRPQPGAQPEAGETIEISLDGTPDAAPTSHAESPAGREEDGVDVTIPDLGDGDGLPTEELLIEVDQEEPAPPGLRPSVQTDTVRVRVIRYQPFPRWALIAAAALVVFAGSALLLRASFLRAGARSTRAATSATAAPFAAAGTAEKARLGARGSAEPAARPAASTAENTPASTDDKAPPVAAELAPTMEPSPSPRPPAVAGSGPAPVKAPTPSSKGRPGGHDFFRDPGF